MKIYWKPYHSGEFSHEAIWGSIALIAIFAARFFPFSRLPLAMPCWFRELSGIPCPSCGGTRAFIALAHARIADGFHYNPAAAILFFSLLAFIPYAAWVTFRRKPRLRVSLSSSHDRSILLVFVFAIIILNWTYLILAGR